ncbi:MAG: signal recognition particle-docking protein FtsY [Spirochaetaceae bacterium]|jgi:fused signal recognition particle receptor|nr:signal recognition particle-docking protein FtsY [Spirochaetaceae bacterium]
MAKKSFGQKLRELFGIQGRAPDELFDDLSDILIEGDLGPKTAFELIGYLEKNSRKEHLADYAEVTGELKKLLLGFVKQGELLPEPGKVNIYLILGVNGVGKTTSAAKLAKYYEKKTQGPVILAAGDTFRAAAIEQLEIHGERLGIRVVAHQHGSDPAAVIYDAADAVAAKGGGLVLADTAGRLHNKENLVRELQKIDRIAEARAGEGCYKKLLVIDATTGQNGLRQAEVFHAAVGVDAIMLTKYDSTAKGGIAAAIGRELGIPIAFVGIGEKYDDLSVFDPEKYVDEFIGS